MNRVDRCGFVAPCATCNAPVNLDATPEALCQTCCDVHCDTHYPCDCIQETPC